MDIRMGALGCLTPRLLKSSHTMTRMVLLLLLVCVMGGAGSVSITVGTYNIWNVMFNWDVRKHHIAEMIRAANLDVIGFQEVRADEDPSLPNRRRRTQVDELQELLLPEYKWSTFQLGHDMHSPKDGALQEWQHEGLALLSRHPILKSQKQDLSHHSRTDKIKRKVLHVTLMVRGYEVVVSVVHFSYDKWQQCNNVAEIMEYIRDAKPNYSILLGDFNTYNDYEGPLEGLHLGYFSSQNKCPKYAKSKNPTVESELTAYDDAWKVMHYGENGFTFSNMPSPGFVSRPDRILASNRYFKVSSAELDGYGNIYAKKYQRYITSARRKAIIEAGRRTYYRESGGDCLHDCGPSGSCQCGVCVRGGDGHSCSVPDCEACSADLYRLYCIVRIVFGAFTLQLFVGLIQTVLAVTQGGSVHRHKSLARFCQLPLSVTPPSWRHVRHLHLASWVRTVLSSCRNLALVNLSISLLGMFSLVVLSQSWFEEPLRLLESSLPEEFNPSDHLMVIAELQFI
ncbi:uncharacterized protein LOC100889507 [Strongylocentrotus purpuratus]|uniref:Endonuclease/exonuclease/phosphatase domain-containing protein n=1 Tax=Strongylocentrotus purpuratus TaxID=7668 RepID=A0A7M7HBW3_STRPU|nr:uncharacterized protein LOC100889507 [Strongylocentrotus purpuratus]